MEIHIIYPLHCVRFCLSYCLFCFTSRFWNFLIIFPQSFIDEPLSILFGAGNPFECLFYFTWSMNVLQLYGNYMDTTFIEIQDLLEFVCCCLLHFFRIKFYFLGKSCVQISPFHLHFLSFSFRTAISKVDLDSLSSLFSYGQAVGFSHVVNYCLILSYRPGSC